MRKVILLIIFLFLYSCALLADQLPKTDFYKMQLEQLKTSSEALSHSQKQTFPGIIKIRKAREIRSQPQKRGNSLVSIALKQNSEIDQLKNILLASKTSISQVTAMELMLNQFSSFFTQNPLNTPIQKRIPPPGLLSLKTAIAQEDINQAQNRLQQKINQVVFKTKSILAQIIYFNKSIKLLRKNLKLYSTLLTTSERLYRNGEIGFSELSMISTRRDNIQIQLYSFKAERVNQLARLHALLNLKEISDLDIPRAFPTIKSYQSLKKYKIDQHPLIREAEAKIRKLRLSIMMLNQKVFPDYVLKTKLSAPNSNNSLGSSSGKNKSYKRDSQLMFSVSFIQQLKHALKAAMANKTKKQNYIESQLRGKLATFEALRSSLTIIEKRTIPELERAFTSIKSNYENGKAAYLNLIDAESNLLKFRQKRLEILMMLLSAQAEIDFLSGKIYGKAGD